MYAYLQISEGVGRGLFKEKAWVLSGKPFRSEKMRRKIRIAVQDISFAKNIGKIKPIRMSVKGRLVGSGHFNLHAVLFQYGLYTAFLSFRIGGNALCFSSGNP